MNRTPLQYRRAALKEANRRRNYEITAKILDVHHLRSVRPATGKIKQKRKSRAACIVAALKAVGSKPSTRASERAAAKSNLAFQTQAAALPTLEVAVAPPTRQCTTEEDRKIRGISCSEVKGSTASVPMSTATPRRQA